MESHEEVSLEAVLGLVEKLSAVEKLKLVERVLIDLEPVVQAREPEKHKPLGRTGRKQTLTEEKIKEIKRKLWGADERQWPKQVVRLGGLWKGTPLDLTDEEFRKVSRELSEALKRRAEKAL
jgi:hypothetical protein